MGVDATPPHETDSADHHPPMTRSQTKTKKSASTSQTSAPDRATRNRARRMYRKLESQYPDARCALDYENPYQLLVATILSAQCTDAQVNRITPALFERYPTPAELAAAEPAELESMIRSSGFYRNKAKALKQAATGLVENFDAQVPDTMHDLLSLRGVARKTANVVLGNAFGIEEGVVVDTHVKRLSRRMGLTRQTDPGKIEKDLMALFTRNSWTMLAHLLIRHGREVCGARKPQCEQCVVSRDCPKIGVG